MASIDVICSPAFIDLMAEAAAEGRQMIRQACAQ